ncbi:unnamed protein product, partial [Hymenolepis diminuta]
PVPPTVIGSIQCVEDGNDDKNVAILRIEYDAVPQPTVSWLKDGQHIKQGPKYEIITSQEESVLRIINPSGTESGTYSAVIMNVAGIANSSNRFEFDGGARRSRLSVRSPSPLSEYQQESSNRASPSYFSKNNEPEERASIESEDNLSQRSSRKSSSSPLPISENNDAEKSRTLERRSPIILSEHRRESGNRASLSFMYDRSNRKTSVESEDNFSQKSGRKSSISPPIPKKRGEVPSAHKRSVEQEIKPVERKMSEISCAMPLEKKGTILSHQTQTAEHPEERK